MSCVVRQRQRQFAAHPAQQVQHGLGYAQQIALLGDRRQGDAALVDQAIAARGVDRQDRVHARVDLVRHHLAHGKGRAHHRHRLLRPRARARQMCVRMRTVPGSTSPCAAIAMSLKATAMATTAPSLSDTNPVTAGRRRCRPGGRRCPTGRAVVRARNHDGQELGGRAIRSSRVTVTSQRPAARKRPATASPVTCADDNSSMASMACFTRAAPARRARKRAAPAVPGTTAPRGPSSVTTSPRTRNAEPSGSPSTGMDGFSTQNSARRWARVSPRWPGGWALV